MRASPGSARGCSGGRASTIEAASVPTMPAHTVARHDHRARTLPARHPSGRRSTPSCSACTTTTATRRATTCSGRPRRSPVATSARTSPGSTAGACTTGGRSPGFPPHPHRGFETVTYVRRGLIDHSDSLGATARFGRGDVQWLTAGRGIVHAGDVPARSTVTRRNPLELFQIWMNLPGEDKLAEPYFAMLWAARPPAGDHHTIRRGAGTRSP